MEKARNIATVSKNVTASMIYILLCLIFLEATQATNPCPSPPCLFYTDRTTIKAFQLRHASSLSTVKSNLRRAAAITVDVRKKLLFWSDLRRDVIQSLNLTSGRVEDVATKDIANVRGIAVDWETGLVYWTDYGRREINVVTYDGTKRKTLVTAGVINPHGIAVDPRNGVMFWTDLGSRPRIQKATLSGHNQTTIVNLRPLSHHWPHGITIDYPNNRLYWIDSMQDQIMSVDFNGKNRISHRSFFDIHAFSLDLLGDLLYWSDSVSFSTRIRTISKSHGGNTGAYYDVGYSTDMGIVVYDQSRQPRGNTSCAKGNHDCQHLCLLSPHGPKCACPDTQILNQDGATCRESTKSVLLTSPATIYQIPLEVPQRAMKRLPLTNLGYPNSIDVNPIDGRVYWTDSWQRSISSAFFNGTSQERIVGMVRTPDGLAVDWIAGNLYWTDRIANRIEVARLDGKYRKTLIYTNLERPTQLVLDLEKRYLYWGSRGLNLPPKIEQADMTGRNRRVLANLVSPAWPTGVSIFENRLYWIDEFHNVLQYVDRVTPRGVVTVHLSRQLLEPSVLTSIDGSLYLSDTGRRTNDGTVVKIDRNTGGVLQNLTWFLNRPLGIVAVDFNATKTPSVCSQDNGNCSHLCLLEPSGRDCACPNGMTLKDDGRTCYFKEFMLFADAGGVRRRGIYKLSLDTATTPVKLPLSNIYRPTALDFDPIEKFLYWSDVYLDRIMRAHLDGSSQMTIINSGLRRPQGLAVDAVGRNLYWTDMVKNVIEVSKLNGSSRKVLVSNLDQPKAIVLDGQRGLMYWSSWGHHAKIERADMNGANITLIQSFPNPDHWSDVPPSPNGLALDPETNLLYWIDEYKGTLQFMDLKAQPYRVQNLISSHLYLARPFGLVLNEENIYWSEQGNRGGIFSITKRNGNVVKRLAWTSADPRDVHVYHNATAIPYSHPCTLYNGWCTHLCLVVPGGYRCACPTITEPGPACLTVPNRPNVTSSPSTTTSIPTTTTTITARGTTAQSTTEKQTTTTTHPTTTEHRTTTTETTAKRTTTPLSKSERTTTTSSTTKEYIRTTPETTQPPQTTQRPQTTQPPKISSMLATKLTTTETTRNPCLPSPCTNEGKCTKTHDNRDGFVCQCKDGYAAKLCDVFYGENKIEMTLEMKLEDWKTSEFKEGMAKIVNEYCEKHDCQAKYKRRRRATGLAQYTSDDVIVVGNPTAVSNGVKVQTVILEPQQENQPGPRKPLSGSLLCAIMRNLKESGSSMLKGYDILALNGETHPKCPGAPIADKKKGGRSGDSSSKSASGPAAGAAVGVLCVLALVIILFYVYRKRKQSRHKEENNIRPNVTFSNPGFQDEPGVDIPLSPTYEEIGPDLRNEILGVNTSLPWQEDFSGLANPTYHGLDRGAARAHPRQEEQVEKNKLKEELRVNMKLEGDDGNHGNNQRSGEYGNHGNGGNLCDSISETSDERYVSMPLGGMRNNNRQTNADMLNQSLPEEPKHASLPAGRSKSKANTQEPEYPSIPNGRSKPKIGNQEPEYSSIPNGQSKPKIGNQEPEYSSIPNGQSKSTDTQEPEYSTIPNDWPNPNQLNTEAGDLYEKMNSDEIKARPPLAPPLEDPSLNGTYIEPQIDDQQEVWNKRTYVNANEVNGLPLQEDMKDRTYVNSDIINETNNKKIKGNPPLDEEGLGNQGDKTHGGQEMAQNNGPRKGPSKNVHEVEGLNNNDETGS